MKRLLVLFTMVYCISNILSAQQPPICGDWIYRQQETSYDKNGEIANIVQMNFILRIKYSDNNYFAFEKRERKDNIGLNYVDYEAAGSMLSACADSISWKRDLIYFSNGKDCIKETHKKAIFVNGTLEVSTYTLTNYYDEQGNIVDSKKNRPYTTTYYRYDQDW